MDLIIKQELGVIFSEWRIWFFLANQEIRLRYRRSAIGPWWITLSMAITIGSLGFLYGKIFHAQIEEYLPYLACGILGWTFISMILLESTNAFITYQGIIQNQEVHFSTCIMQLICKHVIIFFHNAIVLIPIMLYFKLSISLKFLALFPGLLIISINALFYGTFLAIIGTRFRDFSQIIASLMQIIFFFTPIMWMPSVLPPQYSNLVALNPFYHFLNLIRQPLLNQSIDFSNLLGVGLTTCLGFLLYVYFLGRYRQRIVFWL